MEVPTAGMLYTNKSISLQYIDIESKTARKQAKTCN
jgi:hypothetical protein